MMPGKTKATAKAPTANRAAMPAGGGKTPAPSPAPARAIQQLRMALIGREAGARARDVRAMHGALGARRTAQLMRAGQGQRDGAMRVQPKLEVGPPNDASEREADATAQRVMRMGGGACCPSCAAGKDCEVRPARVRRMAGDEGGMPVPADLEPRIQNMQQGGEPLADQVRTQMEPRFGQDFSDVRIHRDAEAANTAQGLGAKAYTLDNHIAFNTGQYAPGTASGDHLMAHELTHVAQQGGGGVPALTVQRACGRSNMMPPPPGCVLVAQRPSTDRYLFEKECDDFSPGEEARMIADFSAMPSGTTVHILGLASSEGPADLNESLSCWRAEAAANALARAGFGGMIRSVEAAGPMGRPGDATFRAVAIELTPPPPPACALPVRLGGARGCGSDADFRHFDRPSISAASWAKLAAWAFGHGRGYFRSLVTDTECEFEMDAVLSALAGGAGHAAFSRFAVGTGGTVSHGPGSPLGAMAVASGSFRRTVARVQSDIEAQLRTQASGGVLDPCALSVTPPATHFAPSDGMPLKAVIGGTQGEELLATGFTGSVPTRSYSINLRFVICDDFGVDESDLYAPGLFAFWVLQHERSSTRYAPFINELDLPVTVTGTF